MWIFCNRATFSPFLIFYPILFMAIYKKCIYCGDSKIVDLFYVQRNSGDT